MPPDSLRIITIPQGWVRNVPSAANLLDGAGSGPSGALPYASRLPVFDLYGLCSEVTHVREGDPGHRLWGLASAVAAGVDVVYPGAPLSQRASWARIKQEALTHVADVENFERDFEPIGIAHFPEYNSDMLADIIWVRRGSGLFALKQKNPRSRLNEFSGGNPVRAFPEIA